MNARALLLILVPAAQTSAQIEWKKYECNPVFGGRPGGWDVFLGVGGHTIYFDGFTYQLWYDANGNDGVLKIGRATSLDGIHWNREPASDSVLKPGPFDRWDSGAVYLPFVYSNGQSLVMFYSGDHSKELGIAFSPNGVNWQVPIQQNPVLPRGDPGSWDDSAVSAVAVLRDAVSGTYGMWYTGYASSGIARIGFAESGDGLFSWRKEKNPVLDVGLAGSWEAEGVYCPSVIRVGPTFHMWFSARTDPDHPFRIGYATSTDPRGLEWKKHPTNPVLRLGPTGTWDSANTDLPRVLFNEKRNLYQLWYEGDKGREESLYFFGYAESPLARRNVAVPGDRCSQGRLTVSIREDDDGLDPSFALKLHEVVSGPIAAAQVMASLSGSTRDLPPPTVTPAGIFQEGRAVGRVPFCPGGNGSVRFIEPDGSYSLEDLGEDIGSAGDSFTFAYNRIQGDFTLTAHLKTPGTPASPRPGRHGLMVRQDLSGRSRFSFLHDRWGDRDSFGDPLDATRWSSRREQGGDEVLEEQSLAPGEHYDWLRIERVGERITGSISDDGGKTFSVLASERWPAGAVLVGLAFSSLASACCRGPSTIEFDEVKLELAPGAEFLAPEPPPEGVEITWNLTRGDLKAGVTYEIALESGDLQFIAGEEGIAVAGEDRVHLSPPACERFRRGDVDGDGAANITDPVLLLGYLFLGGEAPACPDAADADDSGVLDLSDAIFDLGWQFLGGPEPPAPGPKVCGSDPTAEEPPLGPCAYDPARC